MEASIGEEAETSVGAVVFAPQPIAQFVAHIVLELAKDSRAIAVMKRRGPAASHLVKRFNRGKIGLIAGADVKDRAHAVTELLLTFRTRFNMRIPPLTTSLPPPD